MTIAKQPDRVPFHVREALPNDAPAMAACRAGDREHGPADPRMRAYLEGRHDPTDALAPRVGFVAEHEGVVVGFVAGHATRRFGCDGELQYLYVAPAFRNRGAATALVRALAAWFVAHGLKRVVVDVNPSSASAAPFYASLGAQPLTGPWRVWDDVGALIRSPSI